MLDPDISINDISSAYSVAYYVLNRTKRSRTQPATNNNMRNFIKLYEYQKQKSIKLITDFFHLTETPLIAKDIAEYANYLIVPIIKLAEIKSIRKCKQ